MELHPLQENLGLRPKPDQFVALHSNVIQGLIIQTTFPSPSKGTIVGVQSAIFLTNH